MAQRRKIIAGAAATAAAGVAASSFPKPAIAQSMPEIKWRLTSSYPKSLDTLYGAAEHFSKVVNSLTDGKFQIQVFAPGELVPALQALDAVSAGTVEACHTSTYYYVGKNPAFTFGTSLPFGLNARQMNAWLYQGGGNDMLNEFFARVSDTISIPIANTGCQMGGWFRKEIKTPADLVGLKFRIGGFGGRILLKLGVVPQQIAGGDIYPALEKGTIDAAEWIGPYDDEKLGLQKVAQYYYYPGWWEGGPMTHVMIKLAKWNELPKSYQTAIQTAATDSNVWTMAKYDHVNPPALKRLVASGAQLRPFPREVMEAFYKAANEVYAELNKDSPDFKKLYDHCAPYRNEQYLWWQVAELSFDQFMVRATQRTA